MGSTILYIIQAIVQLLIVAIVISAVLSWLVAFDVINMRNRFVYSITRTLDAVTRPVLAPFQRITPNLGGVDISPILAIIVLTAISRYLLPWIFGFIIPIIG